MTAGPHGIIREDEIVIPGVNLSLIVGRPREGGPMSRPRHEHPFSGWGRAAWE